MAVYGSDWLHSGGSELHHHRSCILPVKKKIIQQVDGGQNLKTPITLKNYILKFLDCPDRFVMPKSLQKVQKHISKKRGTVVDALHENSRDAKLLRRAGSRDNRIARTSAIMSRGRQSYRMSEIDDAV